MSILSITPNPLALNLAITVDGDTHTPLTVSAPAPAAISLDIAPGMPLDLTPVLDAVAAIPAVDLQPVLQAIDAIPTTDVATALAEYHAPKLADLDVVQSSVLSAIASIPVVSLAPVLAAIAGIPVPDVAAALAEYGTATTAGLTAAQAAILAAIGSIPATNLAPVLDAIHALPAIDVAAALAAYGAAKPADIATALTAYGVAKASDVANAKTALATAIAALGPQIGDYKTWSNARAIPAGWEQRAGAPASMMSGVYGINAAQNPTLANTTAQMVTCADGLHAFYISGTVTGHCVLNESTGVWDARAASPTGLPFPGTFLTYATSSATSDGGFLVFGGSNTSTDCALTLKFTPDNAGGGTWSQLANLPAGGWGGGAADVMRDGTIFWVPSHKRSGSSAVANTDTWLYYNSTNNTWTAYTVAGSVPALGTQQWGTTIGSYGFVVVRMPSGAFGALTNNATNSWFIINPVTRTITLKSGRPGAANLTTGQTYGYLGSSPVGLVLIQGNSTTYYVYYEATDTWITTQTAWSQNAFSGTVANGAGIIPKYFKLKSGLQYAGGSSGYVGSVLTLGGYSPAAAIYIEKTS